MAASSSPAIFLLLAIAILGATSPSSAEARRGATHIRLYIHEKFAGEKSTVSSPPVISSPLGTNATFGEIGVLDDELRDGEDRSASQLVGRFQGFFVGTDLAAPSYMSAVTLVLTAGEHAGSTITVQGQFSFDAAADGAVERAVVGGTGKFRMAQGYSLMELVSTPTAETAVFKIDVFVILSRHGQY